MNLAPSTSPVPAVKPSERTPLSFTGAAGDFLRLLVRGSLLQIPTLGFYRFWLITDIRRHLWANTRIGTETLEYTGTAREILIGFLFATAVLLPIYVLYFVLGLAAETLQAFASVPLVVILYGLGLYASYRARRYRVTRTIFRGVRFWMTGSAWAYAGRALLWDLLTVATIGLALPWRLAALERYKMRNTRFGNLPGDFVATGGSLFRRGWWLWLMAILAPVALLFISFTSFQASLAAGSNVAAGLAVIGLYALLLIAFAAIYPLFRAIQLRWQLEGVRFGAVTLESGLAAREVVGCYARTLFAMLGYAIVMGGLIAAMSWAFRDTLIALRAGGSALTPQALIAIALLVLGYLVLLLGIGVLKRHLLDRGLWRALVGSATVVNLAAADHVVAEGEAASAFGEGLADALDMGAV